MPEQRYEIRKEKRESPPPSLKGFFSDLMVANYTDHPVVVIDMYNKQHIVVPVTHVAQAQGLIELTYRSTDTPRVDPTQRYATLEKPIDATRVTINSSEIELGPVYVEELELVVCTVEQAPAVNHPKATSVYEAALRNASIKLASTDNFPTLRVYANDPTGSLTEIYAYMFGSIVKVPVTHLPNREGTIAVVITSCRKILFQKLYTIGEFLNKNKFISERNSPVICVGLSRTMVENYASAHERESEKVPEETLSLLRAQIMDDVSSKHKSELAALQTKVSNTVFELQQALQEKRALEFSCTELKQQNAVFQSQLNGYKAIVGCQEQQHLLTRASMQTDMVREKTKQARIATDIERVKHSEVIWKIAGGALIAITSAAITAYLKSGK
jgi:hypothetical protein